eukprot:CAMPEP_0119041940 /NCGR_PEP_ID=MMETSP1177-20130426/14220_1 /TAXON_ID=2985 /ORGANISM="Ochromonas sp, Strain CCMP1899" /LENGTH=288 /DNA_ID=CAMNT_0007008373 /DNA_START=222 /DNA_END=1088 /DNA_ORIENTATION=+
MERILAQDDDSEEKKELMTKMAPAEFQKKSFLEYYGMDDWKIAFPVGLLIAFPLYQSEFYVVTDHTIEVTAFFLSIYTAIHLAGAGTTEFMDSRRAQVLNAMREVDNSLLQDVTDGIKSNEKLLSIEKDAQSLWAVQDELCSAQADIFNYTQEHNYREAMIKKLDSMVALEQGAAIAIKMRMVKSVTKNVTAEFTTSKALQEKALVQAIAVLTQGPGGTMGKDIVGEAFTAAIKEYKTNYAAMPAGQDDILVALEKDMAEVAQAPILDVAGGNVFLTNPIKNTIALNA